MLTVPLHFLSLTKPSRHNGNQEVSASFLARRQRDMSEVLDPTVRLMYLTNEGHLDGIEELLDTGATPISPTLTAALRSTSLPARNAPTLLTCCYDKMLKLIHETTRAAS
ncbi:hypothetical protein DEO72_LG9g1147 [Vigna unguiculata]|uniref:Uncharacterized protein n=1 Tax=Vigna unguiculata TaxID=3917 RepID=A0A4D6MXG8_VIGUN|nr:hypothetical protein DEO72_LG9g1147 [Vigna unguiculata]